MRTGIKNEVKQCKWDGGVDSPILYHLDYNFALLTLIFIKVEVIYNLKYL